MGSLSNFGELQTFDFDFEKYFGRPNTFKNVLCFDTQTLLRVSKGLELKLEIDLSLNIKLYSSSSLLLTQLLKCEIHESKIC